MVQGETRGGLGSEQEEDQSKEVILLKNIEMFLDGKKLTMVVDMGKEFGISSSGKSVIIASTEGNVAIPGREDVKVGLNVYRKK